MIKHQDIFAEVDRLAPYDLAESWDPTGPTLGCLSDKTEGVLLTLDLTNKALSLAKQNHCNLIISHHPFLFAPIQKLMADNPEQKLLLDLAAAGITVFSSHTNLDAAEAGVAVSFLQAALKGLSYKKDLKILAADLQNPKVGQGRLVDLDQPVLLSALQAFFDRNLSTSCQTNTDRDRPVQKLAFTPGAFDESWIPLLLENKVEVLVTGEIKHHVSVMLEERGIALLAAGHGASEQTVIPLLADQLRAAFPQINFVENPGILYNQLRSE